MPNKITQEEFIKKASIVHSGKYSYDKVVYKNMLTKVIIICPIHGEFQQRPADHLKGYGCRECGRIKNTPNSMGGICNVSVEDDKKVYDLWYAMLERCKTLSSYEDCHVCEEWLSFENFKAWHKENYIDGYALDKDLFSDGERIYSPKTCCYIPIRLNSLLAVSKRRQNGLPLGVYKSGKKFRSLLSHNGKYIHIGSFSTTEEAFSAYKAKKEYLIRQEAERLYSNGEISERVFNKLITFKVE